MSRFTEAIVLLIMNLIINNLRKSYKKSLTVIDYKGKEKGMKKKRFLSIVLCACMIVMLLRVVRL